MRRIALGGFGMHMLGCMAGRAQAGDGIGGSTLASACGHGYQKVLPDAAYTHEADMGSSPASRFTA